MGNGAWGMGHGEWGMGHGAWGMGNGAWERSYQCHSPYAVGIPLQTPGDSRPVAFNE
jgi:hypothetical protein